jgi:hypothetical protein
MYGVLRSEKYRPFAEWLCGLTAQVVLFAVLLCWCTGKSVARMPATGEIVTLFAGLSAVVCVGPQVAFILRRGDLRDKLMAASGYVGFGVVLFTVLLAVGAVVGAAMSPGMAYRVIE